jgi:hypothetical protein
MAGGLFWSVLPDDMDAVAEREALARVRGYRSIKRRMSNCHVGRCCDRPPHSLVLPIPHISTRNGRLVRTSCRFAAPAGSCRCGKTPRTLLQIGRRRTRDDRADAGNGHYPSTTVMTLRQRLDLIGHGFNSLIDVGEEARKCIYSREL